jgi:hypothetical protein
MAQKNSGAVKDGWISARATTAERMLADQLKVELGIKSYSGLVRTLITNQAKALNIN